MSRSTVRSMLATLVVLAVAATTLGVSSAATVSKGRPDPSFGSGGFAAVGGAHLVGTAVQSDGKVIVVGDNAGNPVHLLVQRLNTNGSADSSFNGGHPALGPADSVGRAVTIQSDGKIVVAGALTDTTGVTPTAMLVERFNATGTADGSFGAGGVATALGASLQLGQANALAAQSDGKIVAAGSASLPDGYPRTAFARFNSNGSLDAGFGAHGAAVVDLGRYSVANGVAVQTDGKIVFGGSQREDLQSTNVLAGRLNANGGVDGSFAGGAFVRQLATGGPVSAAYGVALQPDGKVVLGGVARDAAFGSDALVVRLTTGGGLDAGFGSGGVVRLRASDSAVQCCAGALPPPGASAVVVSAGEIFAAGYYDTLNRRRFAIWGLNGNGTLDTGFGAGGSFIGGISSASVQATGLAVAPGGNLVVPGFSLAPFSTVSSFVGRIGGPVVTPPPPPPPAVLKVKVSINRSYKIRSVTGRSGLRLTVNCTAACKLSGSLTVSYGAAKRLKLAPRRGHPKTVTIASGSVTLRRAGKVTLTLHFTRSAARVIGKQRSLTTTLSISASSSGRKTVKTSNSLRLTK